MVIAVLLVGCGAGGPKPTANADQDQGYPLTIATAYGDIVLTKKPERIVALAPNYLDLLTTLGLKPVAFETGTVPLADFDQSFPWLAGTYQNGQAVPQLITADYVASPEEIAAFQPDLILATPYTVPKDLYAQISAIAPTYAGTRDDDSLTPWTQLITDIARMTGKEPEAQAAIDEMDRTYANARADLSGLQGKTYNYVAARKDGLQFGSADWESLGLRPADNQATFNAPELSYENIDQLRADVLFIAAFSDDLRSKVENDPRFSSLPASKNGTVVFADLALANSDVYPGPRSLSWQLTQVVPPLERSALNREHR